MTIQLLKRRLAKLVKHRGYPLDRASFLTNDGNFISGGFARKDGFLYEHSDLADEIEKTIPVDTQYENRFNRTLDFMKKNNAIRIHDNGIESNIHVMSPINRTQLNSLHKYIKNNDPDKRQYYDINGDNTDNFGEFSKLLRKHNFYSGKMISKKLAKLKQKLAAVPVNGTSVKINPEHGKKIADAYHNMKHDPNHPAVKAAYDALINETGQQYNKLLQSGLKIDKIKPGTNPYPSSREMHDDVEKNNHLYYFPTAEGYGANEQSKNHPMLRETEFKHEDKPMLANDVFRIVHDINGHHVGGKSGFGPKGEHQAYLSHKRMYSPLANKALFTETAGQNNWVNFGPHGEQNRKDPKNTIYAEQKAGLMPEEIINGEYHNA